jgi:hypothetical protein
MDVWDEMIFWRWAIVGMELGWYSEPEGMLEDTTSVYEIGGVSVERSMRYDLIVGVLLIHGM